jgi:hypothetical protein
MPLVFIHGVNTRNTDEDYTRAVAARRTMFEQLVVPTLATRGFPQFSVAEDIYWGDLGVSFGWRLRSIPETKVLQSLGPAAVAEQNLDIMQLVSEVQPSSSGVQKLGPASPLAAAAQKNPAMLVRAIFAPEADQFAPSGLPLPTSSLTKSEVEKVVGQGEHLGLIFIAVDSLAQDLEKHPELVQGTTDNEVMDKISKEVNLRYQKLAQSRLDALAAPTQTQTQTQKLGSFSNAIGWARDHLKGTIDAAKKAASGAVAQTQRGASLVALKELRDSISRRGLRFLGDVFVYLHHGRTAAPAIYDRVKDGILALSGKKNDKSEPEPLIVVTHSFGSEILYDLLTSRELDNVTIDLWVTAGAQTSLFAEMLLFAGMQQPLPQDTDKYVLGRPSNVKKWINFYDAADVLSYLHEPVFGAEAVKDISVRAQANLTNAHGHYFADSAFYQRIAAEV